MGTGRGTSHIGASWYLPRGAKGGITLVEMPDVDEGFMGAANHYGTCIPM